MDIIDKNQIIIQRVFRVSLCLLLFIGHGIPKLLHWFFGISTWGMHAMFVPSGFFPAVAAIIEFVCPLLIMLGIQVRWSAIPVFFMFVGVAFSRPLPWYFIGIPVEGYPVSKAVIISKEIVLAYAFAYLSLTLFAKNQDLIWSKPKH